MKLILLNRINSDNDYSLKEIALNARNPNFGVYSVVFCYQDDRLTYMISVFMFMYMHIYVYILTDVAPLFKEYNGIHFKLTWFDKSVTPNKERIELISFKDLITIRSFKEELKDCDELWKLSSQNKNALFWSMGICYSLLKTTGVEMWDQLFAHESSLIEKYGLEAYLEESMPPFHNPAPKSIKDETTP
ncbi:hypothetical protein RFI_34808 [Reticulomyxa filosa]|uniref:Uncharacterized protein n=1 Tax=Reticulomyxa filosa TaxID=46433 RepID=X6LPE9_RETFI|nr:hypothetical protein RFI_34808 [Reticulomyxa filosa]|eukprot:ETO02610.1 hypothetical protein RFI_34808 [Reticulomyxa filosa]